MKALPLLLFALFLIGTSAKFSTPETATPSSKWLNGKWTGMGYQVDGGEWEVELEANAKAQTYSINYPSLSCGGRWEMTKQEKNKVEMNEILVTGKDKCDEGVEIKIEKISKREIKVDFYLSWYSKEAIATANLTKE